MILDYRKYIVIIFTILLPLSIYQIFSLKFSFDFEQFFPQGDPDLAFFQEFIEDFETDDNFLLVAIENDSTVFEQSFLERFHDISLAIRRLPHVESMQSLTTLDMPIKTPFGYSTIPLIHMEQPSKYAADRKNILSDKRFNNTFINNNTDALVISIQTEGFLKLGDSQELMASLDSLMVSHDIKAVHYVGRAYFQSELVELQKNEIIKTTFISIFLVSLIMIFIYRKTMSVVIAMGSITISLILFLGLMAFLDRKMNLMSALYPVLMLIVGTSDVIHIMSKYIDELTKGKSKRVAMDITVKQIGLSTLLTSLTTAIGFGTLLTSNIVPIQEFGINAAVGVILAYIVVVLLTTSILTYFPKEKLISFNPKNHERWDKFLTSWYYFTIKNGKSILIGSVILIGIFLLGISKISTDYRIESNLPSNTRISDDFRYFEEEFSGFRPLEFAIIVKDDKYKSDGFKVLSEVSKLEDHLSQSKYVNSAISLATFYKSIERINNGNQLEYYKFPTTEDSFNKAKKIINRIGKGDINTFVNIDRSKTRISSRVADVGAETIKNAGLKIDEWINTNIDTSLILVKRTGTGIIIDKNAEFIRNDLFQGLFIALLLVSLLMALLFRDIKLLTIALIPNIFPVLFAASLLGYLGIELEAAVSIIFAIVFGIAVDDTIHFLSKFKLATLNGSDLEEALLLTFRDTGKAITFTTIILFFGFLVMLFSQHPPSYTVGLLISITLIGAWLCDLLLLPVIIRLLLKPDENKINENTN